MPLLLRLISWLVVGLALGTMLGPLMFMQLVQEGKQIISPFLITSMGILLAAGGYAIAQWRRKT